MLVTKISLSKGENFKNCIWRKPTNKERKKFLNILSKINLDLKN